MSVNKATYTRSVLTTLAVLAGAAAAACGSITVTTPTGVLEGGSITPVTWTTQNMESKVKIDLTVDNGATFTNLAPSVAFNASPYQVTLPNTASTAAGAAFVRVTSLDNAKISSDSPRFTIVAMTDRWLTFNEVNAIRPGAFKDNKQSAPTDCVNLGQVDGERDDVKYAKLPHGILYRIKCTALTGGRADPESFKDFKLSNGWVVSKVDTLQGDKGGPAAISCTPPSVGATSPATTCHMSSDRGGFDDFVVAIRIRGRAGTQPF